MFFINKKQVKCKHVGIIFCLVTLNKIVFRIESEIHSWFEKKNIFEDLKNQSEPPTT